MKYTVKEFSDKFLSFIGDDTLDLNEPFLINAINWSFNELPRVPKLGRLFSKHFTANLDANGHYRWDLNQDFRRLNDIAFINFYSSDGGKPCPINVCHRDLTNFYKKNGLPELKEAGIPCEYTIEVEGDNVWLVLDRPSDIPLIIDYIGYGYPKPVKSMEDEIELSAIAENLMFGLMRVVKDYEGLDYAWAQGTLEYLSNYALEQAIQELNKRWKTENPIILGEV